MLLLGSANGQINVLDPSPSRRDKNYVPIAAVSAETAHSQPILSIEWYPGDHGIYFSLDAIGKLHIWDAATMVTAETKGLKRFDPTQGQFSPNGKRVAVGGKDGVKFFDLASGSVRSEISDPALKNVTCLGWARNKTRFLSVGEANGHVRLYDVRNSKLGIGKFLIR